MAKYALVIDDSKCTGCTACTIACQMHNNLAPEMNYNRLERLEIGTFPNVKVEIVPMQCMHCDNPACVTVCPTQASYKREDRIVAIDYDKCIGCKYCMTACPYDARKLNEDRVPEKCRWCPEYLENGEQPPCSATCMNEVRVFGDLDNPNDKIHKILAEKEVVQLLPEKGTKPRIFYVKK